VHLARANAASSRTPARAVEHAAWRRGAGRPLWRLCETHRARESPAAAPLLCAAYGSVTLTRSLCVALRQNEQYLDASRAEDYALARDLEGRLNLDGQARALPVWLASDAAHAPASALAASAPRRPAESCGAATRRECPPTKGGR